KARLKLLHKWKTRQPRTQTNSASCSLKDPISSGVIAWEAQLLTRSPNSLHAGGRRLGSSRCWIRSTGRIWEQALPGTPLTPRCKGCSFTPVTSYCLIGKIKADFSGKWLRSCERDLSFGEESS